MITAWPALVLGVSQKNLGDETWWVQAEKERKREKEAWRVTVAGATYFGTRQVTVRSFVRCPECVMGTDWGTLSRNWKLDGNGIRQLLVACRPPAALPPAGIQGPGRSSRRLAHPDWLRSGPRPKTEAGALCGTPTDGSPNHRPGKAPWWFAGGAGRQRGAQRRVNGPRSSCHENTKLVPIRPFGRQGSKLSLARAPAAAISSRGPQRLQLPGQCASGVAVGPPPGGGTWAASTGMIAAGVAGRWRGLWNPLILSSSPLRGSPGRPQRQLVRGPVT
jgi:hypothetical protein